jgi:hypothetical protein
MVIYFSKQSIFCAGVPKNMSEHTYTNVVDESIMLLTCFCASCLALPMADIALPLPSGWYRPLVNTVSIKAMSPVSRKKKVFNVTKCHRCGVVVRKQRISAAAQRRVLCVSCNCKVCTLKYLSQLYYTQML